MNEVERTLQFMNINCSKGIAMSVVNKFSIKYHGWRKTMGRKGKDQEDNR